MQSLIVRDTVPLTGVRTTSDGRLLAEPRFARTGIQIYGGNEVGLPNKATVRLYRSPEAVFDKSAMASFAHRTVTNDHPPGGVTIDNFKDEVVGFTGDTVTRDGDFVRVPMMLSDRATIEAVQEGKVELSAGYTCLVDWTPGVTPAGEAYDGQMKNLRGNHVAIVDRARGGASLRIGDSENRSECRVSDAADAALLTPNTPTTTKGERAVPEISNPRAVLLDGLTIHTNDAGAEAITRLQRQMTDAATAAVNERAALAQQITARDGQLAALRDEAARAAEAHQGAVAALTATHTQALDALRGELDALRAQTSDAALDARVAARSALVAQARRVLGDSYDATGQNDAAIRRSVVAKALPTLPLDDSTGDAYVKAAFDAVMAAPALTASPAPSQPDPVRLALAAGAGQPTADAAQQQIPAWKRAAMRAEKAHLNTPAHGA